MTFAFLWERDTGDNSQHGSLPVLFSQREGEWFPGARIDQLPSRKSQGNALVRYSLSFIMDSWSNL